MNRTKILAFIELTKPRILMLVLVTTVIGYYLGGQGIESYVHLLYLLIGSACTCAGSGVLNHYIERDIDKEMGRTKRRPLPSGSVVPSDALLFGVFLIFAGIFILYVTINILTAFLSLLTSFLYLAVYTPMKRLSWLNTYFGAIPGAIPPLGGWAAATGHLDFAAGMLFLILYLWQLPHFYAIAWMYKDDYKKGGLIMLPNIQSGEQRTVRQILISSLILIPVSLAPYFIGLSGKIYFIGSFLAGIALYVICLQFVKIRSIANARSLLRATVIYLPILLILIVCDVTF